MSEVMPPSAAQAAVGPGAVDCPLPTGQTGQTPLRTQPAGERGDRLRPSRWSRLYWHLTALRAEYEACVAEYPGTAGGTLVDYGCGNMPYQSLFSGQAYIGADFPGNEMADVVVAADGTLPLSDGSASIVLSSQVLEHVADVPRYLAESWRVLRSDGLLFLSTHGMWKYHPDPCDLWRWTCDGLRRVLADGGFEVLRFRGVMGLEATALQLWQDAVAPRVPKPLRPCLYRYCQRRIERADRRASPDDRDRDACVYMVVARKRSGA